MKLALLLCAVLVGSGCDGRMRILYLVPPASGTPPWSVAATDIRVEGTEDVTTIVEEVARELKLQPDPSGEKRWFIPTTYNNSFTVSLRKDDKGYWVIGLMDWPTIARSPDSKLAEEKIRTALKRPNKSPEPTTTAVTPRATESRSK